MAGVRSAARELASIGERHSPPDPPRHFLDIDQFDPTELRAILDTGFAYKNGRRDRPLAGKIVAWSGDGNNVAASWVHAAVRFGFTLRLACPELLSPPQRLFDWAHREGGRVELTTEPWRAVAGADCVVTDTWISMGVEGDVNRHNMLASYRVDEHLMASAKPDAIFMHCLPAKRGQEVTAGVIDGPQSVVWDEAENRLHAQKGILAWCLG